MTVQEAVQNIDNLIAISRLTRQEHVVLQGNLKFLEQRAIKADELEEELEQRIGTGSE